VKPSSVTDSRQACFAGIAAPVFQEEGDGLLPLVTRCENSLLKKIFYPKDASRIAFNHSSGKIFQKRLWGNDLA